MAGAGLVHRSWITNGSTAVSRPTSSPALWRVVRTGCPHGADASPKTRDGSLSPTYARSAGSWRKMSLLDAATTCPARSLRRTRRAKLRPVLQELRRTNEALPRSCVCHAPPACRMPEQSLDALEFCQQAGLGHRVALLVHFLDLPRRLRAGDRLLCWGVGQVECR